MAIDRQGFGLTILRICTGVFFLSLGIGKIRWLADSSHLSGQLADWLRAAAPGSISQWYLQRIAMPGVEVFARLVPLGEICAGAAMVAGFWTPASAFVAFFMALNFQLASGAIVHYSFLTNGYGLPVLGATLALAVGGIRLKWSLR